MKRVALLLMLAAVAFAEQRGTVEAKGSLGLTSFVDESANNHLQTGGSVRLYLTSRLSLEPEFQYLRGSAGHHDVVFLPNVNWDFRSGKRIVPYATAGVGWMQSSFRLGGPRGSSFRTNQWYGEFGGGAKIRFSPGWYVAPEFRVGTELNARANVAIGYTFAGKR